MDKKLFYYFILIGSLLTSCSYEDGYNSSYIQDSTMPRNHRVSVEEAKLKALEFVSNISDITRAGSSKELRVDNVQAISLINHSTRSSEEPTNLDSLLYIINFADSCGFVIAGTDDREAEIYAYIENGNYSWNEADSLNPGFTAFIYGLLESRSKDAANAVALDDIECIGGGPSGGIPNNDGFKPNKFEVMYPLLVTKWGQLEPYNAYTPDNVYTGCVVTAMAQICSFLEWPSMVQWSYNYTGGSAHLNWSQIKTECSLSDGKLYTESSADQIAHLMRFLGVAFDAEYGEGGTSVDSNEAIDVLRNYGLTISGLSDYNPTQIVNDLRSGNKIVYMRGNARYYHILFFIRKYVDGHGWVVDGYIDQVDMGKESIYLHCNWGWNGTQNGYFLSSALNAEEDPAYDDNVTRGYNYRYNLEMATFSK